MQRARASAPEKTAGFAERIAALTARLAQLRAELETMRGRQNGFLSHLAQNQLLAQKDRLAAYEVQAQFALADMYDRAASATPPAATDKGTAPPPATGNGTTP